VSAHAAPSAGTIRRMNDLHAENEEVHGRDPPVPDSTSRERLPE
jgi:hypothetical protein